MRYASRSRISCRYAPAGVQARLLFTISPVFIETVSYPAISSCAAQCRLKDEHHIGGIDGSAMERHVPGLARENFVVAAHRDRPGIGNQSDGTPSGVRLAQNVFPEERSAANRKCSRGSPINARNAANVERFVVLLHAGPPQDHSFAIGNSARNCGGSDGAAGGNGHA